MMIVCSNGNPIGIRTAKNLDGSRLQSLGYRHFTPGIRYDISHTKSPLVRLVKIYRYGDENCDIAFYSNTLQPITAVGSLLHIPKDEAIRETFTSSLNIMLNRAVYLVSRQRSTSVFDWIPPLYEEEEEEDIPDFFRHIREEFPF